MLPPRSGLCSRSRSARRHRIPTGLHANLSEGRPVGPARHGGSSLLSPGGFFLGKTGFREAVAAGDVALPQVRKRCCGRTLTMTPKTEPGGHLEVEVVRGKDGCWILPTVTCCWSSDSGGTKEDAL